MVNSGYKLFPTTPGFISAYQDRSDGKTPCIHQPTIILSILPSGKRLHNYGKSSFFMAIFIFGHFQ
jgi:hypothetical protein